MRCGNRWGGFRSCCRSHGRGRQRQLRFNSSSSRLLRLRVPGVIQRNMGLYQAGVGFPVAVGLQRLCSRPHQTSQERQGNGQAYDGRPGPEEKAGDQSVDQNHQEGESVDAG